MSAPLVFFFGRRACAAACFLVLAGCGRPGTPESTGDDQQNAAVETVQLGRGAIEETLETLGTVEFDPGKVRTLTLLAGGQVLEVRAVAGQVVRRGEALLTLGPAPADSVEVRRAKIDVEFAEKELARTRRLLDEKLATNQDAAAADKELATARAVLRSLGEGAGATPTAVVAPSDAIVAQILVNRGHVVPAGFQAAQLAPLDALAVAAGFEAEQIPLLSEGLPVEIAPIYAAIGQTPLRATLSRLHRAVDPATQLVAGLVRLSDPPAWIAAGMKVHVRVVLRTIADAVRVPREALLERGGRAGVFVVEQGKAHFRPLTVGVAGRDFVEGKDGVNGGESVVTTGRSSLEDGMAVRTGAEKT